MKAVGAIPTVFAFLHFRISTNDLNLPKNPYLCLRKNLNTMKKYKKPTMTVVRMNTEKMICNSDNGGGASGGWSAREVVREEEG